MPQDEGGRHQRATLSRLFDTDRAMLRLPSLLLFMLLITGCGQSGDLYLPADDAERNDAEQGPGAEGASPASDDANAADEATEEDADGGDANG